MTLDHSLEISQDVVCRELDHEAVLLDLRSGIYFGLDAVGTRIWQLIVEREALSRVLDALVEEFAADRGRIEKDLLALAEELCSRGLVKATAASR